MQRETFILYNFLTIKSTNDMVFPMKVLRLLMTITLLFALSSNLHAVEKAERISDREIIESLVELKAGQKGLEGSFIGLEKRMDNLEKRMDRLENKIDEVAKELKGFMMWGFGIIIAGMFSLVGFVLWDRRTAVAPVARALKEKEAEIEELKKKERALEDVLRDYAVGDQRLTALMKLRGLL
jgi:Skp family chaperone for outer membrane proteins